MERPFDHCLSGHQSLGCADNNHGDGSRIEQLLSAAGPRVGMVQQQRENAVLSFYFN